MNIGLSDEDATLAVGAALAKALNEFARHRTGNGADRGTDIGADSDSTLPSGLHIHLHGGLGAGKTTLVRGALRAMGVSGSVKSPTYTLVEPYQTKYWEVFHFDLYRLEDDEELEALGVRDNFRSGCLCLFEWPSRCVDALPEPALSLRLSGLGDGRELQIDAQNALGEAILDALQMPLAS